MTNLRNVDERVHNVRLLDDGNGLVFSQGNRVRYLPLSKLNDDWIEKSKEIHEASEYIKFLGRVENGCVPVTLSSGLAYFMAFDRFESIPGNLLEDRFTKVFGRIGQGAHITALAGTNIMFMPA